MENSFSKNLRLFRKEKKVTLVELAHATGISKSTLSDYENQYSEPSLSIIISLSKYFNKSFEELIVNSQNDIKLKPDEMRLHILNQRIDALVSQNYLTQQLITSKDNEIHALRMQIQLLNNSKE